LRCVAVSAGEKATNADISSMPGKTLVSVVKNSSSSAVDAKVRYNGTGKWTVVEDVNPTKPLNSVHLNATSSWVVTPLTLGCNGSTNGDHKEENGGSDRLSNSRKSDKDPSSRQKLHPQCELGVL